ncbi:hypothetical protein J5N97_007419 [Dioscorea zingiberensis]|uniref:Uncharacterized protein n=1 Tax=Dioscorea zingiberensis TaxID=325984 RepID=A0A9D5DDF9_9LILI|nr:hypothetical protein J5N97_007419 [Dioscorea zingiberensis]
MTKRVRQSAVMDAYKSISFPKIMSIADLGCSSGPNTLLVASDAIDAVELVCKELNQKALPELQILLNDLPGNDFNGLISSLQGFQRSHRCFTSVVPGSFYGRLFPSQSLHFIHTSSSLHWLSQCRAEEIVHGGRMVLTLVTRKGEDPSIESTRVQIELLARALMGMATEGLVEMEKIDSFNLPYYTPTSEEVENAIKKEGSFAINSIQIFDAGWGETRDVCDHKIKVEEKASTAQIIAKIMRAAAESLLLSCKSEAQLPTNTMALNQLLHMNGGHNDHSYAKNSNIQNLILSMTEGVRQRPNTLLVASDAIDAVELVCKELNQKASPELQILLNDLPGNDFNGLISSLQDFQRSHRCFISVVPGSFYGRLFPSQSLHFIHSSSSLHWLSQVPLELQNGDDNLKLNKGNIYISKTSPPFVLEAYSNQFQRDLSFFLKCRAEEIVKGGCMVLTLLGWRSSSADPSNMDSRLQWDLLAHALMDLASQGVVEKEKIDSFNVPFYSPSLEEVKYAIETEGSFGIKSIECFKVNWDRLTMVEENESMDVKLKAKVQLMAKCIRACTESLFVSHFGEEIIDELFVRYNHLLEEYFTKNKAERTHIIVYVKRIDP